MMTTPKDLVEVVSVEEAGISKETYHIDEFKKNMMESLEKYVANWKKENKTDKEHWPLELPKSNAGAFYDGWMGSDE